ncbi:uncharacterized protein LOC123201719 [Mangifera indica]|uniref:uncharacterized protein LOC123201719 n=1 Tax=Mangifera indica TaxID=29780 RepID=UPI001CFB46C9|nr:uncharacterized protein LOC123201719 [Mangifera indica]
MTTSSCKYQNAYSSIHIPKTYRFLESSFMNIQGMPLVQFIVKDMFNKITHRTLGGAIAVSSTLRWETVEVDCVDTEGNLAHGNGTMLPSVDGSPLVNGTGNPQLRAVFWVDNKRKYQLNGNAFVVPFLDLSMVHVIPLSERDRECHSLNVSACISCVRLGGGMNYAEALLHRFGILGPDGGPGEGLSKGLKHLSAGPLSKLFKASALTVENLKEGESSGDGRDGLMQLGLPDDVDVSVEFRDWLFALEGAQEMAERWCFYSHEVMSREERCWHTTFRSLSVKARSSPKEILNGKEDSLSTHKYPVELVIVSVEGLQTLKPQVQKGLPEHVLPANGIKESAKTCGGINVEARLIILEDSAENEMVSWMVENLKFSVKEPIEAVVTKDELQHLALLCKSEVDSMGRITAGVLRLLKLEKSIGQAAINQLSNLGSEGLEQIFSPKHSRGNTGRSTPAFFTNESPIATLESTLASLEKAVLDSQAKCAALITNVDSSESSIDHLSNIKQLSEKLESMQSLLARLWTQKVLREKDCLINPVIIRTTRGVEMVDFRPKYLMRNGTLEHMMITTVAVHWLSGSITKNNPSLKATNVPPRTIYSKFLLYIIAEHKKAGSPAIARTKKVRGC